jgi:predicted ester cyclase
MTTEANKRIIARYVELYNSGDLTIAGEVIAGDFLDHAHPEAQAGPPGVKQMVTSFRRAFPDATVTVEELIGEGDIVAFRFIIRGTHEGLFGPLETPWRRAPSRRSCRTYRKLYCMESPECWFEDFGTAQLVRGSATVALDPQFAAVVHNDQYHIFLTPLGDCKGLFVSTSSANGFVVRELQAGTSTLAFSYRLVARRKDVMAPRLEQVTMRPEMLRPAAIPPATQAPQWQAAPQAATSPPPSRTLRLPAIPSRPVAPALPEPLPMVGVPEAPAQPI